MLISGTSSPRATSRVDLPISQSRHRPCRGVPPDEQQALEEDVVFEWSKSHAFVYETSKRSKSRTEGTKSDTLLPELFTETGEDILAPRPPSGSVRTSSLSGYYSYEQRGSVGESGSPSPSRCESIPFSSGPESSSTCSCYATLHSLAGDNRGEVSVVEVVDIASEHEFRTRERIKSGRFHVERGRSASTHPKSARKVRHSNEERYLQEKYRERPCSRAESFVNDEMLDTTSDLSRECCDVLGPWHCYDCNKILRRNDSFYRSKSAFPSIHMTPKNFSTITLVQRLFPELTTLDILEGVADGYISSRSFSKDRVMEIVERKRADAKRKEIQEKWKGAAKRRISAFDIPDKVKFFSNFTDLRAQILAQQGSYTGLKGALFPLTRPSEQPPPPEVELVLKKEEDRENPANYFCPPLMTREEILRQKSQPRFYAGAQSEYKLPEAPPLTDILHKSNKAMRDLDTEAGVMDLSERGSPAGRPRPARLQQEKLMSGSKLHGQLGGGGGMFGKPPGRMRLGRPEIGGGFTRKSMTASSFSRPLQMETLNEDGSQSEREDVMEDENDEEQDDFDCAEEDDDRKPESMMSPTQLVAPSSLILDDESAL
ncbi:uncharacterized protein [Diadema antillarum]|uniref:uncharacterized protein n=1 Tax=Diadema antillarum TaxID=105358 RepID=UPI003A870B6C